MRQDGPPDDAQALRDLGSILGRAGDLIARTGGADADRLLPMLRATVAALETAAGQWAAASASGHVRDAEAMTQWRHDLRTPATAMAGWAQLHGQAGGEAARIRAVEAIERNAKLLVDVLLHPPS